MRGSGQVNCKDITDKTVPRMSCTYMALALLLDANLFLLEAFLLPDASVNALLDGRVRPGE